jgi:chaperonin cofactor prefoldin
MDLERELKDVKRRLDLAETRLAQLAGQFEFISGQLRDVQLYMHARFGDIDDRLDKIDGRLDKVDGRLDTIDGSLNSLETKVDALPRALAEMIASQR